MNGIELQRDIRRAGATLPKGAYLYTALVHLHRSSAHLQRQTTAARFVNAPRVAAIPHLMGTKAGRISGTYFAGSLSPYEVLRRHTFFGYLNLALDKVDASDREEALVQDTVRSLNFSIDRVESLRWCECCAEDELEVYGFASWKVVHQLPSVRICHIHEIPLLSHCKICGSALGTVLNFRLPGDACPKCKQCDFTGDDVVVCDAYRLLVRNIAKAFENQEDDFRYSAWNKNISSFIESFISCDDAQKALKEFLCTEWGISSLEDIFILLQAPLPAKGTLFDWGDRHLSVRVLLCDAMRLIRLSKGVSIIKDVLDFTSQPEVKKNIEFADVVKRHALKLNISMRIADVISGSLNIKLAASAAGLDYAVALRAWKIILMSMKAELGGEEVRRLLPEGRRVKSSYL